MTSREIASTGRAGPLEQAVSRWAPTPMVDQDYIAARPMRALAAALDVDDGTLGDAVPLLWHWLYFLDWPAAQTLAPDGHPWSSTTIPPIEDRIRMWAGGRAAIVEPLTVGQPAERLVSVSRVRPTTGSSGEMVFVTSRTEIRQEGRLRIVEETDAVYRSRSGLVRSFEPPTGDAAPKSQDALSHTWLPDPVLLFRFSALTGNSHRIHYDGDYARAEEGYPGVVVHGPLLALLMSESVRQHPHYRPVQIDYRLHSPVFLGESLSVDIAEPGSAGPDRGGREQLGPRSSYPNAEIFNLRVQTARLDRHATARVTVIPC